MNFNTVGGRRFFLAFGAGVMTTILQWFGKLDPSGNTYSWVIIGTVGAYISGATFEQIKSKPNNQDTDKG